MRLSDLSKMPTRESTPEQLEDSEKLLLNEIRTLRAVLNSLNDGVIVCDRDGHIIMMNPAGEELIGLGLLDVPPEDLPMTRALKGEEVREAEIFIRNEKKPHGIWLSVNAKPLKDSTGILLGGVSVFREITERKRAEEVLLQKTAELARAQAEREQLELFTHLASHDLQAPLQKIVGFGDLLEAHSAASLDEKGLQFLRRIQEGALRMSQLMDGLVEFAKAALKEKPFEPTDLQGIIREVVSDLEIRILKTKARVDTGTLPVIQADKIQMHELFLNLVSNAIKFHKKDEPPHVFIKSEPAANNGYVEITVEDNGVGFDDTRADRIFKPFERLCAREDFEGIGMGLAICQRIVLRHKGEIKVKSAPGKGSVFTVTLPLAQNP